MFHVKQWGTSKKTPLLILLALFSPYFKNTLGNTGYLKQTNSPGEEDCPFVWMWGVKEKDMGCIDKRAFTLISGKMLLRYRDLIFDAIFFFILAAYGFYAAFFHCINGFVDRVHEHRDIFI